MLPLVAGILYFSLIIVFLSVVSIKNRQLAILLLLAFIVRFLLVFVHWHVVALPDSSADAVFYVQKATEYSEIFSNEGFYLPSFGRSVFYPWLLGGVFLLTGPSFLVAQLISVVFGVAAIYYIYLLSERLFDARVAYFAGLFAVFFPTLILYSSLPLRESYFSFFFLQGCYFFMLWEGRGKGYLFVICIMSCLICSLFHIAGIVSLLVFFVCYFQRGLSGVLKGRVPILFLFVVPSFVFLVGLYLSGGFPLPKVGYFSGSFEFSSFIKTLSSSVRSSVGGAGGFSPLTVPSSVYDLIPSLLLRFLYFLYSPFLWDVTSIKHLLGVLDSFCYFLMSCFLYRQRKYFNSKVLSILLVVLCGSLMLMSLGVGNFGTAVRHRSKFVGLLIVLAFSGFSRDRESK